MKRIRVLLYIMLIAMPFSVKAALTATDYTTCLAFASPLTIVNGSTDFRYCYRAGCSSGGTWNLANMSSTSIYRCGNNNGDPYVSWKEDGCSKYTGKCTKPSEGYYCTKTKYVDCNRKSDGSPFVTQPTTTTTGNAGNPDTSRIVTAGTTTTKTSRRTGSGTTRVIIPLTTKEQTTESTRPVITTDTTAPPLSSNLNINSITINDTDILYRNGYEEYTIKLPYGITDLDIVVDTEDEKTVTYIEGAYNMPDEDTQILIEVVAEDGSTKDIIINVNRYAGESNDCNIANIVVNGYDFKFDKNNYQYNLRIKRKTKSLDLEIIPSDPLHANVEVLGNEKLKNNSSVSINVKAENGTMCTYNITVKKSSGLWIPVLVTILIVGIVGAAGYFIYMYIKRSKDQYQYE